MGEEPEPITYAFNIDMTGFYITPKVAKKMTKCENCGIEMIKEYHESTGENCNYCPQCASIIVLDSDIIILGDRKVTMFDSKKHKEGIRWLERKIRDGYHINKICRDVPEGYISYHIFRTKSEVLHAFDRRSE